MRQVALISQTLRAGYCHAYMNDGDQEQAILTANPSAFSDYEFAAPTSVIEVSPPPELIPATHLARSRIFRSMLGKARSGSKLGAWLERTVKTIVRRLRTVAELAPSKERHQTVEIDIQSIRSSAMYLRLAEEHSSNPINRLVVFDVFDLPVAFTFAEDHKIEVLVR